MRQTSRLAKQIGERDPLRSGYVRHLVQNPHPEVARNPNGPIPKTLVQFWDDAQAIPGDVRDCLATWEALDSHGFTRMLFDDGTARRFIAAYLGHRCVQAFDHCPHPAMRADYFRLSYILVSGGFYVDADEAYLSGDPSGLLANNCLRVRPLCYDRAAGENVPLSTFLEPGADSLGWVFYVGNSPLLAPPRHPILRLALARATRQLLDDRVDRNVSIQSLTGPHNLTASLVKHAVSLQLQNRHPNFAFITDWDDMASHQITLSYKSDARDWRLWSRRPT
jgi:hypothetical protein